jgi:hypothetical protein
MSFVRCERCQVKFLEGPFLAGQATGCATFWEPSHQVLFAGYGSEFDCMSFYVRCLASLLIAWPVLESGCGFLVCDACVSDALDKQLIAVLQEDYLMERSMNSNEIQCLLGSIINV